MDKSHVKSYIYFAKAFFMIQKTPPKKQQHRCDYVKAFL